MDISSQNIGSGVTTLGDGKGQMADGTAPAGAGKVPVGTSKALGANAVVSSAERKARAAAMPVPNGMRADLERWAAMIDRSEKGGTLYRAAMLETRRTAVLLASRFFSVHLVEATVLDRVGFTAEFEGIYLKPEGSR